MTASLRAICLLFALGSAGAVLAEDAYYDLPIQEVKLADGSLPVRKESLDWRAYQRSTQLQPYVIVDGPGEAYLTSERDGGSGLPGWDPYRSSTAEPTRIRIRAPQGNDVAGQLVLPNADLSGMVVLRFTVPASAAKIEAELLFYQAKNAHYERLLQRGLPGGAWFRHQSRAAKAELHLPTSESAQPNASAQFGTADELTRTYELFTGGRAMSENLQLERELLQPRAGEKPVKLDTLEGITIQEIDWKPLLKDASPKLDALASSIPADQHVVLFPSFSAALAIADEASQHDTPVLRLAQPQTENARVVERYQTQLGLSMSSIARLLGPQLVQSVALTGSDPFFLTGTDVAVLFESPQPAMLENLLTGRIAMAAAAVPEAKPISGEIAGVKYRGFLSPDRTMSSYLARLDGVVVVTNSRSQLSRLAETHRDPTKAIAALPEFHFFRTRYPLGDGEETALVYLSDATIRRWCGPRWRIADSRRTRARAVLAELQAWQLDALVKGTVKPGAIHSDLPIGDDGELLLTASGVHSSTLGSLAFMTPIGEIPLDEVTEAEANAYRAWREGYQRNWSWAFDPIALRISLSKEKAAADLTVMPLILHNDYRELASLSLGSKLDPTAGDPHDALAQFVLGINRESLLLKQGENFLSMMGKSVSLGWIGRWATLYLDDDPAWKELKIGSEVDLMKNASRLPVALGIEAGNPLQLAIFLSSVRAFIEQSSPGLTQWESLKYKDQPYVRIAPVKGKRALPDELENLAIYYTAVGGVLTITPNEATLQRTIDRWLAQEKGQAAGTGAPREPRPWLGENVALRVDRKLLEVANVLTREQYQRAMQEQCWANLPILNEWKRLYPDRDPVQVHQQVWGVELLCPGGGKYVWNETYRTMESTVYGHPGEPKEGPPAPPILSSFTAGNFGLTFEHQGLRARVELERPAPAASK